MPYSFKNIKIKFRSNCCNSTTSSEFLPCQNSEEIAGYLRKLHRLDVTTHFFTLTFKPKLLRQHWDDLHEDAISALTEAAKINKSFYYITHELEGNHNHYHGITDMNQGTWNKYMAKFGSRNTSDKSFQQIKSMEDVWQYVTKHSNNKDKNIYKPHTNLLETEVRSMPVALPNGS